jgi:hypothetical protein
MGFAPKYSVPPAEVQELSQRACPDGKMRPQPDVVSAAVRGATFGSAGPLSSQDRASDLSVPHAITPPPEPTARGVPFGSGAIAAEPIRARVGVSRETRRAPEVRIAARSSSTKALSRSPQEMGYREERNFGEPGSKRALH